MTPEILAKTAGMCGFRVRRHFRPEVFARLNAAILKRYAQALALTVEELKSVPDIIRGGKEYKNEHGNNSRRKTFYPSSFGALRKWCYFILVAGSGLKYQ